MARFAKDTEQLTNKAYAEKVVGGANTAQGLRKIVSLQNRFQNGYLTDLTFMPSSTDYIQQPMIVKVLRAPTGFAMLPNGKEYITALVNVMETLMQSWDGFNRTLSVGTTETQIGRNEVFETPTKVTRARTNLTSTIVEKDGMPIIRFFDSYVRILIQDPDVGHPLLTGMSEWATDGLADMYSMDLIAWEPDKTFRYVQQAYLLTNVFPKNDIGENTGNRNLEQAGDKRTYNLSWACIQKVGYAVDQLAQKFMDSISVKDLNPEYRPNWIEGTKANIEAVNTGFLNQVNEVRNTQVQLER